jgi:hypothetical protein
VKLRREARTLKAKAVCSLRRAVSAFNACDDDGRTTSVLLHMQHAAEMLLKAILVQRRVKVFDPNKQTSIGFEKCVNLATQHAKLSPEEAGLLRAVDALRDAEQHWLIVVPEEILYLHARGFVTTFDDLLKRTLGDALADHLPMRVLPISTQPGRNPVLDFAGFLRVAVDLLAKSKWGFTRIESSDSVLLKFGSGGSDAATRTSRQPRAGLFRARLDQIVDLNHELAKLARASTGASCKRSSARCTPTAPAGYRCRPG